MRIRKHSKAIFIITVFSCTQILCGMFLVSESVHEFKQKKQFTLAQKEPLPFKTLKDVALLPERFSQNSNTARIMLSDMDLEQ